MSQPLLRLSALEPARVRLDEGDDARSIGEAMRAVLLFLAIIGFLAWAGVVEASTAGSPGVASAAAQERLNSL